MLLTRLEKGWMEKIGDADKAYSSSLRGTILLFNWNVHVNLHSSY